MTEWMFVAVMVWHALLLLLLLVHAVRAGELIARLVAFDAASLVLLSALVVLAVYREEVAFLDIALVLAMLVFVQTLAAARLIRARRLEK